MELPSFVQQFHKNKIPEAHYQNNEDQHIQQLLYHDGMKHNQ
jgi:hypothetical protein